MSKAIYTNKESLNPVRNIISKAGEMTSTEVVISKNDTGLSEILAAATGMGVGAAGSFAALSALGIAGYSAVGITSGLAAAGGIVGGGMVAGIGVLAAPIAILGVGGYALVANKKKKELLVEKKVLLPSFFLWYFTINGLVFLRNFIGKLAFITANNPKSI